MSKISLRAEAPQASTLRLQRHRRHPRCNLHCDCRGTACTHTANVLVEPQAPIASGGPWPTLARRSRGQGGPWPALDRRSRGSGGPWPVLARRSGRSLASTGQEEALARRSRGPGGPWPALLARRSQGPGGPWPALARRSWGLGGPWSALASGHPQGLYIAYRI